MSTHTFLGLTGRSLADFPCCPEWFSLFFVSVDKIQYNQQTHLSLLMWAESDLRMSDSLLVSKLSSLLWWIQSGNSVSSRFVQTAKSMSLPIIPIPNSNSWRKFLLTESCLGIPETCLPSQVNKSSRSFLSKWKPSRWCDCHDHLKNGHLEALSPLAASVS